MAQDGAALAEERAVADRVTVELAARARVTVFVAVVVALVSATAWTGFTGSWSRTSSRRS